MSGSAGFRPAETPSYDREEVIATITDFYQFLSKLPWIKPEDVLYPPKGGWPNITEENFSFLSKNSEVITLLKHLPYIRMDGKTEYMVAPQTFPCDYRRDYFQSPAFVKGRPPYEVTEPDEFEFPPWVVGLTYGKNKGDYLMLDTSDGTVIRYQVTGGGWEPEYPTDDPRSWRNECEPPAERITDFIAQWKKNYESLEWIGFPRAGHPYIWEEESCEPEKLEEMQNDLRSCGWPDDFNRDDAGQALTELEK